MNLTVCVQSLPRNEIFCEAGRAQFRRQLQCQGAKDGPMQQRCWSANDLLSPGRNIMWSERHRSMRTLIQLATDE